MTLVVGEFIDMNSILDFGARVTILEYNDPNFPYYNPSIAWDNDKLKISIRSCNFTVQPDGTWTLADGGTHARTKIMYGDIDPDSLKISNLKELKYADDSPEQILTSGLEDARIFKRKDGMHFMGVRVHTPNVAEYKPTIAEFLLKGDTLHHIRTLEKPDPDRAEKNWLPTDVESDFFVYSIKEIWKDGQVIGDKYTGNIHGGTQLIKQEDGYISILHAKNLNPNFRRVYDKYDYVSYFAEYWPTGYLKRISKPFKLGTGEKIEFASGMVEHGKDLLISFGIRDRRIGIVRIPKQNLMDTLEEYGQDKEPAPPVLSYAERRRMRLNR